MPKSISLLLSLVLTLGMSASVLADDAQVSGHEITSFLSGKTANCIKTSDESTCDTFFGKDGTIKRFTPDNGKTKTGKWWVDADGMLNVQFTGKKKPLVFKVVDPRDGTWKLLKGGSLKSLITGATPGDKLP